MDKYLISQQASLLEALEQLNSLSGEVMTLVTLDREGRMAGTLTDGDIRRGLLAGYELSSAVGAVAHRKFRALRASQTALEKIQTLREARSKGIALLPELDADGRIIRLIDLRTVRSLLPVTALLMAGGKGERLRPLTLTTPKPLLKIGGRAIIDYNIENLARCGVSDVWVSVKYLADQMREYFATERHGIHARCVEETMPLGTIGAASLIDLPEEGDTLVMNSDLLTTIDLEEMYLHHKQEQADITIAAVPYTVSVPYAILKTDGHQVKRMEEKPTYTYFANAGIYLFSNRILATLQPNERVDAPDLIEAAINGGFRATYYPINGTWIDIGSPEEFRHAEDIMKHHRQFGSR